MERVMDEGVAGPDDEEMGIPFEDDEPASGEEQKDGSESSSSEEEDDIVAREIGQAELTVFEDLDFTKARSVQEAWTVLAESHPPEVGKALSRKERSRFELKSSTLVYGEITLCSLACVIEKVKMRFDGLPLGHDGVFYDIGSGVGKTVFAAAMLRAGFKRCVGIEILSSLHNEALELQHRWDTKVKKMAVFKDDPQIADVEVEFINADASRTPWTDAAFVMCNSTCFDEDLMRDMASQANAMPEGSFLVTTTKRLPSDKFKLLDFEKMKTTWGDATFYIQRKEK
jgi:hypothetical protein